MTLRVTDRVKLALHNGRDLFGAERDVEAEVQFRLAVSLDPKNVEAWYNLGLALYALKKLDESKDAFKNVAFLNPYRADVYNRNRNNPQRRGKVR